MEIPSNQMEKTERNEARRQYIRNFKKLDTHMVVKLHNGTQL